jgi:hypothetical protein
MVESENLSPTTDLKTWQHFKEFVAENEQLLAALSWRFYQEKEETGEILGLELHPEPHFVACSQHAIETLNQNADNRLREMLGIVEGYKPEEEVLIIGMDRDRLQLVFFVPRPTPPECCEEVGQDLYTLLDEIEAKIAKIINSKQG